MYACMQRLEACIKRCIHTETCLRHGRVFSGSMHARMQACIHTCMNTYMHTRIRTLHTYTHTHSEVWGCSGPGPGLLALQQQQAAAAAVLSAAGLPRPSTPFNYVGTKASFAFCVVCVGSHVINLRVWLDPTWHIKALQLLLTAISSLGFKEGHSIRIVQACLFWLLIRLI